MIGTAHAATDAAGHAGPFYTEATFWVAVAFVIFVVLVGKRLYVLLGAALDDRARSIRQKLDEAAELRREAEEILHANQRRQREATQEAQRMVERAREEAERLRTRTEQELEASLKRREQLAKERIAQAEQRAIDHVRETAAAVAIDATRRVLAESLTAQRQNAMIDSAIKELPDKLH